MDTIQLLKEFIQGGASSLIMLFMTIFIIIMLSVFSKGLSGINMRDLFVDERSGKISHTKFWSNVAYLSATIAFLFLNLFYFAQIEKFVELLWLIYLAVVASSAALHKLISYKYGKRLNSDDAPSS